MSQEHIQKQLKTIRASYLASLKDKNCSIQRLWKELQASWQAKTFEELYIIIHSLAGSAGTFDLPDITDQARVVVDLFKENKTGKKRPNDELVEQINAVLDQLLDSLRMAK